MLGNSCRYTTQPPGYYLKTRGVTMSHCCIASVIVCLYILRAKFKMLVMTYKVLNSLGSKLLKDHFSPQNLPLLRSHFRKHSFEIARQWNSLRVGIRTSLLILWIAAKMVCFVVIVLSILTLIVFCSAIESALDCYFSYFCLLVQLL